MILSAQQIKAARALLDWTQEDLVAATGLSIATICSLEKGNISPRSATNNIIHQVFENSGLEFEPKGVRVRDETIRTYDGDHGCDNFFNDVLQTIREKSGEVVCGFRVSALMSRVCGLKGGEFERLEQLSEIAPVKCLVGDLPETLFVNSSFQIRTAPKLQIGATSFIEYGNKHAMVLIESASGNFTFVVFQSARIATGYREHFYSAWENAMPIPMSRTEEFLGKKLND